MTESTDVVRQIEGKLGELLDEHVSGGERRDYAAYADDPVGFIRDVLGDEPWSRQVDVAEAVRDHSQVAVRSCNGAGKDWLAARLALWWVYARGGLVVLTGPTQQQVEEILMRSEVRAAFEKAPDLPGDLHVRALRPRGKQRAGIVAKTASQVSALTGLHDAHVLFIITEAQHERLDLAFDAAFASAVGEEDRILALGNPLNPGGRFFRVSRSPDWRAVQIPASDVPNVRQDRGVIPGLITSHGVERIEREYGRQSGFYRARVLAEFPEQRAEGLFRRSWLDDAAERWQKQDGPADSSATPLFALDPGRYGRDASVLAVRKGDRVEELVVWEDRTDTMTLADRVQNTLSERGIRYDSENYELYVDEVGVGAGVLDRLKAVGCNAYGFKGGRKAFEETRFYNQRAQSYWMIRSELESGTLALPPDEKLFEELLAFQWRPTPDDRVQLEAKADVKGRLGRSPDRADAVAMVVWAQEAMEQRLPLVMIGTKSCC